MIIFNKEYDGEGICDINRDIMEAFNSDYNEKVKIIPQDENSLPEGTFTVQIIWNQNV